MRAARRTMAVMAQSKPAVMARRPVLIATHRALSVKRRAQIRAEHNRFYDRRETNFVLHELERIPDPDGDCAAVLDSCESFIDEWHHLDPLLDKTPPQLIPGGAGGKNAAVTPEETKQLINAYKERGFVQLDALGLPFAVQCSAAFTLSGAFSSNPLGVFTLTRCAADLLEAHGSEALKDKVGTSRPPPPPLTQMYF